MFTPDTSTRRPSPKNAQRRLTEAPRACISLVPSRRVRSLLTLGATAIALLPIACSETSDGSSPSTGSTLGAQPSGGTGTSAPTSSTPTSNPPAGGTTPSAGPTTPGVQAPGTGPTAGAPPATGAPAVPDTPSGGQPSIGPEATGGAGGTAAVGPDAMSSAGGAGGTPASTGDAGGAATGGASAGGAGGASAGEMNTGGAGGAPSQCDTSPGMAMQFAEGVVDQMTGNLGSDGPSGDGPRTLELWAKFTGANSWTAEQTIIELGRRNGAGDMIWGIDMSGRDGNGGRFGPYTNGVTDNNGASGPFYEAAPDVGWLHLAWAYEGNGGEMVFTVNGEKLPIQDPGSNYTLNLTPGIVTLGASQNFGATGWNGIMDEVRIWNVYRSPQEITDAMNVFLTGDEEGLVAYYNFDDSDGSFVDDVKGTPSHRLEPCTAGNDDRCTTVNDGMPMIVASDIPGPFSCAE